MSDAAIVFDVGATNMRIADVVDGTLAHLHKVPTPQEPGAAAAALARFVEGRSSVAVAGCIPGNLDEAGVLSDARNLPEWEGMNIQRLFSSAFGASVTIENDAGFAGLGESHFGAGKGAPVLAYLTVSTGVGGARIVDGAIDRPAYRLRPGRIPLDGSDLESLISGAAIKRRYNLDPRSLTDKNVLDSLADLLARGLSQVVDEWKPDLIVLGGAMILGDNPIPLARVQEKISVPIKKAALGDDSGLYGALAYVRMTAG